jgi:nucleosome assembly protein 1-like 1
MSNQFSFNFDTSASAQLPQDSEEQIMDIKELTAKLISQLPEEVQPHVKQLQTIQEDYDKIESEYHKELFQLNLKYEKLYQPLYTNRANIVHQGVPAFWAKVLENSQLAMEISEKDKETLQYLQDVSIETFTGRNADKEDQPHSGFVLKFKYAENPYFKNTELTQTFYYDNEDHSLIPNKADGCIIEWKSQDKDLTVEKKTVKARGKKNKNAKATTSWVPVPSFYRFFGARTEADDEEPEDEEEVDASGLNGDIEVASYIKDQVIPHAFEFFLGIVPDEDEDEDLAEMFGGEDDEEEEEEEIPVKKSGGKKKSSQQQQQQQQENPQECKQQ